MEEANSLSDKSTRMYDITAIALSYIAVFIIFHFYGNSLYVSHTGRSLFVWIGRQWIASGGDFSHGWLMPLFSIYAIWYYRDELKKAPKTTDYRGCLLLIISLLLHIAAYRAQQPRLSLIAMVGVLMSIPFAFYGSRVARLLLFPCGYLLLAFTSYFLVSLTFKLRLLSTVLSVGLLNGLGIVAVRNGTAIFSPTGLFGLDVADPCSGLRSLVTITAIAAPYAWMTQKKQLLKWALFLTALPIAVLANSLRIVTIAIFAVVWGQDKALKIYHDYSGYILFFFAVLMLVAVGRFISDWQKRHE